MEEFLPTLIVIVVFALVALRRLRRMAAEERRWLWVSFAAHQLAGVANVWVSKYYYGYGDMISYQYSGVVAADGLRSDFWGIAPSLVGWIFHRTDPIPLPIESLQGSSGTMQAIAGFAAYFLFDSLYAACAFIGGIAFFSKIALYKLAREELPDISKRLLLLSCTLVPSVVFWTSSLLKEPIAMSALLFALPAWKQWVDGRFGIRGALRLGIALVVILLVKGYIIPPLAVAVGVWYLVSRARDSKADIVFKLGHVVLALTGALVLIAVTGAFLPTFAVDAVNNQLAQNQSVGATLDGGSNYSLGESSASTASQLSLAPLALLTALFRPALFEAKNALMLINALEMTVFTIACFWVLFRPGITAAVSELFQRPFLSCCAVFVVLFGIFTGLGSTNLGTLSRYRAPLVPFFALFLVAVLAKRWAPRRLEVRLPSPSGAGPPVLRATE